jgi:hypothetical protein
MNIKKKKLLALVGVGFITFLTNAPSLTSVYGALSAPASYDLNYQYDAVYEETFMLGSTSIGDRNVIYTRTSDGAYYNYTTTISNDIPSLDIVPEGLEITMTFNRSNTNWFFITGGYLPSDTKIGSDGTVGTISNKLYFSFDNQSNLDYRLYFDISSSAANKAILLRYYSTFITNVYSFSTTTTYFNFLVPAFTNTILEMPETPSTYYFDAWYLKELGVSASYDAGVDSGYIQGQDDADLLITGFQAMVGILVNFVLMIVNLEVFGVSILGIFSIIVLFTTIVWVLKLIRG